MQFPTEKVTILRGANFVWIQTMWIIQKHTIFRKKKSMKAHHWGMNSLYKNVQIKLYKFI